MKVKPTMTLPDTVQPNGDINVEDISTDIEIDLTGSLNDLRFAINPFKGNVDHFNMEVDGQTENVVGASGATIPETPHDDSDDFVAFRSEEHTSELQSRGHLVCRLLLEKKKTNQNSDRRRIAR